MVVLVRKSSIGCGPGAPGLTRSDTRMAVEFLYGSEFLEFPRLESGGEAGLHAPRRARRGPNR